MGRSRDVSATLSPLGGALVIAADTQALSYYYIAADTQALLALRRSRASVLGTMCT